MSIVVLLRGMNVGGHRTFRPTDLARQLRRFDVENVGAAGTFIVRGAPSRLMLRSELGRRLPAETEIMLCDARDILSLVNDDPFPRLPADRALVPFVSVMSRRASITRRLPIHLPTRTDWGVKVIGVRGRFVYGIYRRQMKAIGQLGQLDRLFGVPLTTRSWTTIQGIARRLETGG